MLIDLLLHAINPVLREVERFISDFIRIAMHEFFYSRDLFAIKTTGLAHKKMELHKQSGRPGQLPVQSL